MECNSAPPTSRGVFLWPPRSALTPEPARYVRAAFGYRIHSDIRCLQRLRVSPIDTEGCLVAPKPVNHPGEYARRTLAGSVLLIAQKPPPPTTYRRVRLAIDNRFHQAVSLVVPCHDEEMNVGPLTNRLLDLFDPYIHEIILVNDNSKDETARVINELARQDPRIKPFHRAPPNGVGRAIVDGLRAATGEYMLSLDCDFQNLLPEIRDLFDGLAEGYDVACGSRFSRHSVLLNYPLIKIIANRGFHIIALHRAFATISRCGKQP